MQFCEVIWLLLIEFQIIITSWAIVSLAGGSLGKVEVEERQAEKEKSPLSHPRQRNLG